MSAHIIGLRGRGACDGIHRSRSLIEPEPLATHGRPIVALLLRQGCVAPKGTSRERVSCAPILCVPRFRLGVEESLINGDYRFCAL